MQKEFKRNARERQGKDEQDWKHLSITRSAICSGMGQKRGEKQRVGNFNHNKGLRMSKVNGESLAKVTIKVSIFHSWIHLRAESFVKTPYGQVPGV